MSKPHRLYNQYSAYISWDKIPSEMSQILHKALEEIWEKVVQQENIDPRHVELFCHHTLSNFFAENIIRRTMKMRKAEKVSNATAVCDHNDMVPNNDPKKVWKCAKCGYVYGNH